MKVDPGRDGADVSPRVPLRVLIVEDSSDDALLMLHELQRGGYEPEHERVDTPEARIRCTTLAFTNSSADIPLATLSKAPDVLRTGGGSVIDKGGVLVGGRLDAAVQQPPKIHRFLVDAVEEG
jgi:hypothetical protein